MSDNVFVLQSLQPTTFDAGAVFSGTPSGHQVQGYASPNPFTPARDPNYIFHESSRDLIVWFAAAFPPVPRKNLPCKFGTLAPTSAHNSG